MVDVVIIGAGTAGLTAGIYAARAGKDVLILESKMYGGQIVNSPCVENYPGIKSISGYDFANSLYEQAMECGAKFEFKEVLGINLVDNNKEVICKDSKILCKNVIIATGASHKKLGLQREEELIGKGVSYCATCDGRFFSGRKVAVNGGGNTALMDAEYLAPMCEKVYLIHRRDEFRGDKAILDRLEAMENVEIIRSANIIELEGNDFLEAIKVKSVKDERVSRVEVDGLFIAVGQEPATKPFSDLIDMDKYGYIIAGEDLKTNVNGIFVAGDVRTKQLRQLATASADGAIAGSSV